MKATLYYDGACPLCRREIEHLAHQPGAPVCVDIHRINAEQLPRSRETMLRTLHLYDPDGAVRLGLEANIHAWRIAGARVIPWLLTLPAIHPLAALFYRRWAAWRYQRRYGGKV